jgi:hypothetical protein
MIETEIRRARHPIAVGGGASAADRSQDRLAARLWQRDAGNTVYEIDDSPGSGGEPVSGFLRHPFDKDGCGVGRRGARAGGPGGVIEAAEGFGGQVVDGDEDDVVAVEDGDCRAGRMNDAAAGTSERISLMVCTGWVRRIGRPDGVRGGTSRS